jgi:two-component system, chemotaxis family, sensor kinase CheA
MDDLLADFVAESREMLEALGGEIVAWEADPADRARLDSIFRFVHTVKGNCGFFDFPRLEALSHAAEDALADVRAGRRPADNGLVTAVLAVIDRISDMVDAIEAGTELPEGGDDTLIRALEQRAEPADDVVVASAAGSSERQPRGAAAAQRSIRLPIELLDRVMSSVSDMVLARNDLARRLRELDRDTGIEAPFERLSSIIAEVRDAMTRTRMQRIETLFVAVPRLVRDLAAELGKQVMVDIEGGDVELDREMIEMIRDPLTHIIRNAIDHGMEPPHDRQAAGKREIGLLTISARQSGNQIMIDVVDDGRGIDGQRLVDKAVAAGLLDAVEGSRMSARDRCALIFEPGLSTAEAVTAISGRGVGMDVVRANIERVGGAIEVDSTSGHGTRVTLRVPLTLSIIPALTISAGGQRFAVPRSSIEEIVHAGEDTIEITRLATATLAKVRDRRLPCISLGEILRVDHSDIADGGRLVVLRLAGGELFALAVDELHDHEELVVKPVAPAIMSTGIYAGTTLTDDGSPILLLDVAGLAAIGGLVFDSQERTSRLPEAMRNDSAIKHDEVLLFVALDGQRRAIRMPVVGRIDEVAPEALRFGAAGPQVVIEDRLFPLAGAVATPSADDLPSGKVRLFRLTDGRSEIAYALREVLDIKGLEGKIVPAAAPGPVEGVTLIDGAPAELVDVLWHFANLRAESPVAEAPVCRLPEGDAWVQNFLRPLAEAAGYRIAGKDEDVAAVDIAIALEQVPAEAGNTAQVILLRESPEAAPDAPDSLYRYDRDALAAAFAAARKRISA